jgi:uncharacterized protein YecT (DUF1311 family)
MMLVKSVRFGVFYAFLFMAVGASDAKAQQQVVPKAEMTAFRACLATAQTSQESKACDTPLYEACNEKNDAPDTTVAMIECTAMQTSAWDHLLNEVWPQTLAGLSPTARTKLRAAQRIWITLRKADCDAVFEANIGGTIRGPAYGACMAQMTKERYFLIREFSNP